MGWMQFGDRIERQQGVCNGRVHDLPTYDFDAYHKACANTRRAQLGDAYIAVVTNGAIPVSTRYVPLYRIHSREFFHSAEHFYLNWDDSDRRRNQRHRFSPEGAPGYYFGLTLDAAIDEALHYSDGQLTEKQIILMMDCYVDNILYLMHPLVLHDIWNKVGLPTASHFDMYLAIMDTRTDNPVCRKIGLWAREQGFDGLIYPSARYDRRPEAKRAAKNHQHRIPLVNFVPLGTMLCAHSVEPGMWFNHLLYHQLVLGGDPTQFMPVAAEPNLVLFSNHQITAFDRATFYFTFPVAERERVAQSDRRTGSKSYSHFVTDEKGGSGIAFVSDYNTLVLGDLMSS